MYNGVGLQTARGSGMNGFEDDQFTVGVSKKHNKAILEHEHKRQIHLKLAILEDKLVDQGYSDAEIAQKLEEARVNLEVAAAANEESVV
ncbi:PREDICTED: pre-mRNA-splicing factor CWC21-like [Camelina sativa]|uniref:Pre-mRNA-splicing factor CWC21-like n=1 Tax=Camelina sativa TaxID=90675 RepID=A0ABM0SKW7_CAMSA|nr:PREDICTED: pre-mRNA-splicing factor CWC21-like [Camelina sativa]